MGFIFLQRHAFTVPVSSAVLSVEHGEKPGKEESGSKSDLPNADDSAYRAYCASLGIDIEKGTTRFADRVRRDYRWHTVQYWLVATLANGLLWAQIIIGAALTALGASSRPGTKTATIYLGASSTIIAGLLTYFKSRNQPNRSRQLRQALRSVRNKMDEGAADVLSSKDPSLARDEAHSIIKMYDTALADAAANYPDLWVTVDRLRETLPWLKINKDKDVGASAGIGKTLTDDNHLTGIMAPVTSTPDHKLTDIPGRMPAAIPSTRVEPTRTEAPESTESSSGMEMTQLPPKASTPFTREIQPGAATIGSNSQIIDHQPHGTIVPQGTPINELVLEEDVIRPQSEERGTERDRSNPKEGTSFQSISTNDKPQPVQGVQTSQPEAADTRPKPTPTADISSTQHATTTTETIGRGYKVVR